MSTKIEIVQDAILPTLPESAKGKQELTPVRDAPASEKSTKVEMSTCTESPKNESDEISERTKRKQELKLDLDLDAPPQMIHKEIISPEASDESSENSLVWQRLPMGTGDVRKKRNAYEQQIKALSIGESSSTGKIFFFLNEFLFFSFFLCESAVLFEIFIIEMDGVVANASFATECFNAIHLLNENVQENCKYKYILFSLKEFANKLLSPNTMLIDYTLWKLKSMSIYSRLKNIS